jgi:hypothetical protein
MRTTEISSGLVRHARLLRVAALIAGAFYLVATVGALMSLGGWGGQFVSATLDPGDLPLRWAAATAAILALLTGAAMLELARMLGQVGRDGVFTREVTRRFRRFALLFLLTAIVRLAMPVLVVAGLSLGHSVRLSFDGGDAVTLLVAALFYLVARLFDEAARLEDDSRSIV